MKTEDQIGGCAEARSNLGVYVLGRLDADDELAVERHLAQCTACRADFHDLRRVPQLLSLTSRDSVEHLERPPTGRLTGLLEERRRRRRQRRRKATLLVGLVTIAVIGLGVGGGRWLVPPPATQQGDLAISWERIDPRTNVEASVTLTERSWGTQIDLRIQGVRKGDVCALVVVDRQGARWAAGSWTVAYASGARWSGGVAVRVDEIARIDVDLLDDMPRRLISLSS